jgi:hypothetical protein
MYFTTEAHIPADFTEPDSAVTFVIQRELATAHPQGQKETPLWKRNSVKSTDLSAITTTTHAHSEHNQS